MIGSIVDAVLKSDSMAIAPMFKKAYWSLAIAGGIYFVFLSFLLNGWVQRQSVRDLDLKHNSVDMSAEPSMLIAYLRLGGMIQISLRSSGF